jgi:hypothetical protein
MADPRKREEPAELEHLVRLLTPSPFRASGELDVVRSKLHAELARRPPPTRQDIRSRSRWLWLLIVAPPLLTFLAFGAVRAAPRPTSLVLATGAGSFSLAALLAAAALHRGRSMLPPAKAWLVTAIVATPVALLLWKIGTTLPYANMMLEWQTRPGTRCFRLSCLLSLAPLGAVLWLRRRSQSRDERLVGGALGAVVGAFTWGLVDLWCPVGYVPHLLVGHVLPLVLAILVGLGLGKRVLSISSS